VEVPDPQAEETFERSRPDWTRAREAPHAALRSLYRDLLALRREEPALRPGDAGVDVRHDPGEGWIVLRLAPIFDGHELLAMFNLSDTETRVPAHAIPAARWRLRLSTEDAGYRGDSDPRERSLPPLPACIDGASSPGVVLAASSAAIYRREDE
jgi:maltooligosyltrehalose trehalohydrolase